MAHLIAPSLLSADFLNLQGAIEMLNKSEADWLHFDVMDGVFAPNISFGLPILKAVKKICKKPIDVHLMLIQNDPYILPFKEAGADHLTVHLESSIHLHRTLQGIKQTGMKAGIAINPHTPIAALKDIVQEADLVCLMSVNPGFGGQHFITNTLSKIKELKQLIEQKACSTLIEVDGGVGLNNYREIVAAGANVLVAGNSVYGAIDPIQAILDLKK